MNCRNLLAFVGGLCFCIAILSAPNRDLLAEDGVRNDILTVDCKRYGTYPDCHCGADGSCTYKDGTQKGPCKTGLDFLEGTCLCKCP
jgi:hypothetical protein